MSWQIATARGTIGLSSTALTVLAHTGGGVAPIRNIAMPYAMQAGGVVNTIKTEARSLALQVLARGTSLAGLHHVRRELIDLLQPDTATPLEPVSLIYSGGSIPLTLRAFYDGGLELSNTYPLTDSFTLRWVAPDSPLWMGDTQTVSMTGAAGTQADPLGYRIWHIDHREYPMPLITKGTAATGVFAALTHTTMQLGGTLFYGGKWTLSGAGSVGVLAYTGGGSIASYMASTLVPQTFYAGVTHLKQGPGGYLHAFVTDATLQGQGPGIVVHRGGSWASLPGTFWVSGHPTRNSIEQFQDSIYWLTGAGSVGLDGGIYSGLVRWDGTQWWNVTDFWRVGSGTTRIEPRFALGPDDRLYISGVFNSYGPSAEAATASTMGLIRWDGSAFEVLGTSWPGLGSVTTDNFRVIPQSIFTGPTGNLGVIVASETIVPSESYPLRLYEWAGGGVREITGALRVDTWGYDKLQAIGSAQWLYASLETAENWNLYGQASNTTLFARSGVDTWTPVHFWIGKDNPLHVADIVFYQGTMILPAAHTATVFRANYSQIVVRGHAPVRPVIQLNGGRVLQIYNATTRQKLFLGIVPPTGETHTINTANNTVVSSFRGVANDVLLPGSSPDGFSLVPGTNHVYVHAGGTATFTWTNHYWSNDL